MRELLHNLSARLEAALGGNQSYVRKLVAGPEVDECVKRISARLEEIRPNYDLTKGGDAEWKRFVDTCAAIDVEAIVGAEPGIPQAITIGEVGKEFEDATYLTMPTRGSPTYCIVKGVDALNLPSSKKAQNHAIVQVASQFNFLEAETSDYNPINMYMADRTQGPRASLSSLAALIWRDHYFKHHDINSEFFDSIVPGCYKNGYFEPWKSKRSTISKSLEASIVNMKIFAQWGIPVNGWDGPLLQIFTAAPSYQDMPGPGPQYTPFESAICATLVVEQYRAVARIAVMRSRFTRSRVPLHLTLVGQGVFKNPPSVLKEALAAVYETIRLCAVDVYIHGYNDKDIKLIHASLPRDLGQLPVMNTDEFFRDSYDPVVLTLQRTPPRLSKSYIVLCHDKMDAFTSNLTRQTKPGDLHRVGVCWKQWGDATDNIQLPILRHNTHYFLDQHVLLVASFHNNDATLSQLHLLAYLCKLRPASITLLLPFYSTGTSERVSYENPQEVPTASTLACLLNGMPSTGSPIRVMVYDIHMLQEQFYFAQNAVADLCTAIPLLLEELRRDTDPTTKINCIAFPDDGANKRFAPLFKSNAGEFEIVVCKKTHLAGYGKKVEIETGNPENKNVLIVDDMTRSGNTMFDCIKALKERSAVQVGFYVTHAVMTKDFWDQFKEKRDNISKVYVTNSRPFEIPAEHRSDTKFKVLKLEEQVALDLWSR